LLIQRIGKVLNLNPFPGQQRPGVFMGVVPDGDLVTGLRIDAPFPAPLETVAQFAYWWPNAARDVARCQAHLMVMCSWSKHSRLDAHMRHMVVVREMVEQLPTIGVLWGHVLVQADKFRGEFAGALNGEIPFPLWVLIQFSKQPNGNILISTLGMRDFGQMEIETESTLPLDQTFDLVRKFGTYILANGPVVKDGQTFGLTEQQRIKVSHIRSFRADVNESVFWLELADNPSVPRPKGYFSALFGSNRKQ
jgi:hypothetical protein